jgi:hypothetical protein
MPQLTSHIRPLLMHSIRHNFPSSDMLRCVHARNTMHIACLFLITHQQSPPFSPSLLYFPRLTNTLSHGRTKTTYYHRRMHPLTNNQSPLRRPLRIILRNQRTRYPGRAPFSRQRGHDDTVREVYGADAEGSEELAGFLDGAHCVYRLCFCVGNSMVLFE